MSRDWPPTGASLVVDVMLRDGSGSLTNLTTRVLATDLTGLTLLPPIFDQPSKADPSGGQAVLKWHDPDSGPSTVTAELGDVTRFNRGAPWRVTITGPVVRNQRRRHIREQVPGRVTLTQPVGKNNQRIVKPSPTDPRLLGEIADLSEGGVRVLTTQPPHLDMGRPAQVQLEPFEGPSPAVPDCQVVRMEAAHGTWSIVLTFPESHPEAGTVRSLVFAAMRHRVRAVHAFEDVAVGV